MKKRIFSFVFLLLSLSIYCTQLTILDWNVENFFDTIDNPDTQDTVLTEEEYEKKFQMVSSQIKEVDADIVCLCEIENIEILQSLSQKCCYDHVYLTEGNDERGINIAVMSKIEIHYKSHKNMNTPYPNNPKYKFSRDCTVSSFTFEQKEFYILLNHLKSMLGADQGETKRIAQVNGILDIIEQIYQNDKSPNIIITGDFNSKRHTEPLNILEKAGLKIVNYKYKQADIFTYKYRKELQDLDYFIINDELDKNAKSYKMKTFLQNKNKISDHNPIELIIEF